MKTVNTYLLFLCATIAIVLHSCSDDFLQRNSLVAVSSATFWSSEDDALSGLAACYDGLQDNFLYNGDIFSGCGPVNMDCMTDNGGHFNWSGWMPGYDICNGIHTPSSWMVTSYWMASYEEIKRCNTLISNIEKVPMDATQIAIYKAEAVVLRSLMYTNLTMAYHNVPYFTSAQSVTDAYSVKTDRATIVADVIKDLKDAATVLPETASSWGRVTKGAALALAGRLALYNQMWDEAISAYRQVKGLGYSLYTGGYKQLFTEANEQCNEIIMSVRYEGPGKEEGTNIGAHYDAPLEAMNGTIDLADSFYDTDGTPTTDKKIVNSTTPDNKPDLWDPNTGRYANRDPRLKATLYIPWEEWNGTWKPYGGSNPSFSTLYVMKYFNTSLNSSTSWDGGQDFYIIRYAEVLLSLAEALVEKDGYDYAEVVGLVNEVRSRVGVNMPTVGAVEGKTGQLDQAGLREVIRHERRVETAFEGLRLFDLYRWKELKNAVDRINKEAADYGLQYERRNYRGDMEYVWPIPLNETDSNRNLEQHDLWK